jgi:hypothetical protein
MVRESFEMSNKPRITQIFTDSDLRINSSKLYNLRQSVKSVVDYPKVAYG